MKNRKQQLILTQVYDKQQKLSELARVPVPSNGWVNSIRTAINMSLGQLGKRTGKTAQGIKALEQREKTGAITLQTLHEIAAALDMQFVYALVPKEGTLEEMVNKKAAAKAKEIIDRTSKTMALEDQENDLQRLQRSILEKQQALRNEMPKFLWD